MLQSPWEGNRRFKPREWFDDKVVIHSTPIFKSYWKYKVYTMEYRIQVFLKIPNDLFTDNSYKVLNKFKCKLSY